jgi:hypothetical protein
VLEDFDYCIKYLTGFKEYLAREKQIHQDYEDEVKLSRAKATERTAEINIIAWMPPKEDESKVKSNFQKGTKQCGQC